MLMKMALRFVEPHLNKIPSWLESMASEYNVDECFLVIRKKKVPSKDNPAIMETIPMMVVWGNKNGKLTVCKDANGKEVEYGIGSLFGYMGEEGEDED